MTSSTQRPARVLDFEQTKARLGVGRSTLFRLIESGELNSFKLARRRLFLEEDVDHFLRQLAHPEAR